MKQACICPGRNNVLVVVSEVYYACVCPLRHKHAATVSETNLHELTTCVMSSYSGAENPPPTTEPPKPACRHRLQRCIGVLSVEPRSCVWSRTAPRPPPTSPSPPSPAPLPSPPHRRVRLLEELIRDLRHWHVHEVLQEGKTGEAPARHAQTCSPTRLHSSLPCSHSRRRRGRQPESLNRSMDSSNISSSSSSSPSSPSWKKSPWPPSSTGKVPWPQAAGLHELECATTTLGEK